MFERIAVLKASNACVILTGLENLQNTFWTPPNGLWFYVYSPMQCHICVNKAVPVIARQILKYNY